MSLICWFDDDRSGELELVGGKGANLGVLSKAGFEVPPGFSVTTEAYAAFLSDAACQEKLDDLIQSIDYNDQPGLEKIAANIRSIIREAPMPESVAQEIKAAYAQLGEDTFVAVRSSATTEDLAEASFAGQHDTYLDIQGHEALIESVRDCWASLWTGRATLYRHSNGIEHGRAQISVVIQEMIPSEVSGVMFTGNPVTTATDEIVINASWGLGEAIVQGLVTPDEYIVKTGTLKVLEKTLGTKAVQTVRDPETGRGTIEQSVQESKRTSFTLSDEQASQLAELGRRVQNYYQNFPQDTEWGFANGAFFLLQSRPITGVAFSWDIDVEEANLLPDDDDTVWSRSWADELTTGAMTPLNYSLRQIGPSNVGYPNLAKMIGYPELSKIRAFKYWKGQLYANPLWDKLLLERTAWPAIRENMLGVIPPVWRDDVMNAEFRPADWLRGLLRTQFLAPERSPYGTLKKIEHWRTQRPEIEGLPTEAIQKLSDEELVAHLQQLADLECEWFDDIIPGFYMWMRDALYGMKWMVDSWYDGDLGPMAFPKLCVGTFHRTATTDDNVDLWQMTEQIRKSTTLSDLFRENEGSGFFTACENSDDGREFLETYRDWLRRQGHRGHADRDLIYPRRCEDLGIDYRTFALLLKSETPHPEVLEEENNKQREMAYENVLSNIRQKPLGAIRAEAFKIVYRLAHEWLVIRDNERSRPTDVLQFAYKRGFMEVGKRLHERGLLDHDGDHLFLSWFELKDLFRGRVTNVPLLKVKVAARKHDVEKVMNKSARPAKFLQRNRIVDLDAAADEEIPGLFRGLATSGGTCTATARVVRLIDDIGKVNPGEILVTNSTDPGWASVFVVAKAVVTETGGMLSHASCLTREYGMPSVQLPGAMDLIPDGVTITVDGDLGTITIDQESTVDDAAVDQEATV